MPARQLRRLRPGRLAWKLAAYSVLLALLPALFVGLRVEQPWLRLGLLLLIFGASVFVAAAYLIMPRLALARELLRQIRRRSFENLELAHVPQGDELNSLIWQVYRTGRTLEKEIEELKRMENYRREFLGNVSHELKTPIFSIRGFTETLLEADPGDEATRRAFLEKILRNADRLANLVRDLTEISRLETGELQLQPVPFELPALVREVLESMEPLAATRQVSLRCCAPEHLPRVLGDRERLRQVLINLVDNAIKYNNSGGFVEVRLQEQDGSVRVAVVDNGIGIAPQHIPRLTERFYRVDRSRSREQGGTGLGLAIVKHILNAHQTRLEIESTPGKGSTFAFRLPVAR
ncbi:sensor histidine kinase [Rhodothermus marinus]|uniref:sensor histidine kinase n=1 Tax=Rhodothermus marinus TaxID=29549 RepID=UPI0012BA3E9F|nr:ATP-binding protein [Rhodothermus marinus]BBM71002.1 two-component sensor histidine kinase [Rhodothermus marinus]BBM73981.1 two-component sensor histidine kinase [Rhodothermus marinus]